MYKFITFLLLAMLPFLTGAQTVKIECYTCDQLKTQDCADCSNSSQRRYFKGLLVKQNGKPTEIDAPVKFYRAGNFYTLEDQEGDRVVFTLSQTIYTNNKALTDYINDCNCQGNGSGGVTENLATDDLNQDAETRTYNQTAQDLIFTNGTGFRAQGQAGTYDFNASPIGITFGYGLNFLTMDGTIINALTDQVKLNNPITGANTELRFHTGFGNTIYAGFAADPTMTGNYSLTWPTIAGDSAQFLRRGTGNTLEWGPVLTEDRVVQLGDSAQIHYSIFGTPDTTVVLQVDDDFTTAHTLHLDPNGADTTANGYADNRPYAGIATASRASEEQDNLRINSGTYVNDDVAISGGNYLLHSWIANTDTISYEFAPGTTVDFNNTAYAPILADLSGFPGTTSGRATKIEIRGKPNMHSSTGTGAVGHFFLNNSSAKLKADLGDVTGTFVTGNGQNQPWFGYGKDIELNMEKLTNIFRFTLNYNDDQGANDKVQDGSRFSFNVGEVSNSTSAAGQLVFGHVAIGQNDSTYTVDDFRYEGHIEKGRITTGGGGSLFATTQDNSSKFSDPYFKWTQTDMELDGTVLTAANVPPYAPATGGFQICNFDMSIRAEGGNINMKTDRLKTNGSWLANGIFFPGFADLDSTNITVEGGQIIATGGPPAIRLYGGNGHVNRFTNHSKLVIKNAHILVTGGNSAVHIWDFPLTNGAEIWFDNCIIEVTATGKAVFEIKSDITLKDCILLNDGVTDVISTGGTSVNVTMLGSNYSNGGNVSADITQLVGTINTSY